MSDVRATASPIATQSYTSNPELYKKLNQLRYTVLSKGHRVLMARAIADTLSIPATPLADFNSWFLTKKLEVVATLDRISEFVFINDKEEIVRLVRGFVQWRHSMFFNPPGILAVKGLESITEEFTSIGRFVDPVDIASLADIYNNINHLYAVFRAAATYE